MPMAVFGQCAFARKTRILSIHSLPSLLNTYLWKQVNLNRIGPHVWKELVLAVIGEQFEPVIASGDEISGLTVSIRQYDDIFRLWNTCANSKTPNLLTRIKELLPGVEIRNPFYKGTSLQEDLEMH